MVDTPIAYIIFNRPRYTRQTFAAIRAAQPKELFLIADGPRSTHPEDAALCQEVREIVSQIDWPCLVQQDFAPANLGLKGRVSSGLNWVFSKVERAIILEDDCLPHPDFFSFCDDLLERYANDERVWVITGDNHQMGKKRGNASYFFSHYSDCWGWATWGRAWKNFQGDIPFWPEWRESLSWQAMQLDQVETRFWLDIFSRVHSNQISSSWFYPWLACIWYGRGLTATANVNLVSNIGIGPDATHTVALTEQAGAATHPLGELLHPHGIEINRAADRCTFNYRHGGLQLRFPRNLIPLPRRWAGALYRKIRRVLKGT
jgi:hypothetical protein